MKTAHFFDLYGDAVTQKPPIITSGKETQTAEQIHSLKQYATQKYWVPVPTGLDQREILFTNSRLLIDFKWISMVLFLAHTVVCQIVLVTCLVLSALRMPSLADFRPDLSAIKREWKGYIQVAKKKPYL